MKQVLQDWVTSQAQVRPDATALVIHGKSLTYGNLEKATNQFARLLKEAGCRRGDRICFAIPKSFEAIIAILGILKADCVHVPIDIASPAPRVSKLLDSADPRYLLGVEASAALLESLCTDEGWGARLETGWMEENSISGYSFQPKFTLSDANRLSAERVESLNRAEDAAHILFTSGSTGDPKGVVITHANVIHFVNWATRYLQMRPGEKISGHPPLHFDLATFDIFGAFAAGAELHLVPPDLSLLPNKLADFIRKSELNQWFSVPSVLNYMAKFDAVKFDDFPALKRLLWCGEVFPTPALIYWMKRLPKVSFTNLYGPTEATIASSYYRVEQCPSSDTQPIPIGTACEGEQLLVLDRELHPAPQSEVGDLYIGGVGLSPGYWRDQEKTNAAFVPYGNGQRIYRTGDLARVGEDGLVYFVGRADTQIKSRGYRIELGEIEAALNSVEELKESATVAVPTEGFENYLICCAYVPRENGSITHAQLRVKLGALLPSYMLPSRWTVYQQLPKNPNGKIDRRKIQEAFAKEIDSATAAKSSSNGKEILREFSTGASEESQAKEQAGPGPK
jgi:amino acid adenylation domain-containing protein